MSHDRIFILKLNKRKSEKPKHRQHQHQHLTEVSVCINYKQRTAAGYKRKKGRKKDRLEPRRVENKYKTSEDRLKFSQFEF